MQIRIRGGRKDTEVKELTVSPWGDPAESHTVAIATPVANRAHASRNISWSAPGKLDSESVEALDNDLTLILS